MITNNGNVVLSLPKQFVLTFKDCDYVVAKASLRAYRTFADEIKYTNPTEAANIYKVLDEYDKIYEEDILND